MNAINAGDAGIWVTCNRGQEAKCTSEARELFIEVLPLNGHILLLL